MYIRKDVAATYTMELNEDEYKAIKEILNKLIFNPNGVSNQFKLPHHEIEVLRQMNGYLYTYRS